jgi:hypothetical protein
MKFFRSLTAAAAALIAGCVAYTPVVQTTANPKPGMAYLTGLYIDASTTLPKNVTLGVTYENVETGVIHTFKFEKERMFQALEVPPGNYRVKQWFMASMFNETLVRGTPKNPLFQRQVKAAAGQAYFLGQYTATGTITHSGNMTYYNTQLQPVSITPSPADQRAFAERYPNLGKLPLVRGYE